MEGMQPRPRLVSVWEPNTNIELTSNYIRNDLEKLESEKHLAKKPASAAHEPPINNGATSNDAANRHD